MSENFKKEVLEQLRRSGSDITKSHHFEYYLYVPRADLAKMVEEKIRRSGWEAKLNRAADGNGWLCLAKTTFIPADTNLDDHSRFLEELAAAVGGDFDGWESEIVK